MMMISMFMAEKWGVAAGCGDCGLVDYGRSPVKGWKR